jgi:hypothetical protein
MDRAMTQLAHRKGGALARLAGMLCGQSEFLKFAGVPSPAAAADWIRQTCGVPSRADLDHSEAAARKFHANVRKPYLKWKEGSHG